MSIDWCWCYENPKEAASEINRLTALCEEQEADLEHERLRLAACGVAALCNTEQSIAEQGITADNPYYSASYRDICDAVKREMDMKSALSQAREESVKLQILLDGYKMGYKDRAGAAEDFAARAYRTEDAYQEAIARAEAAEQREKGLREAFALYGWHSSGCACNMGEGLGKKCSCGFEAALAAASEESQ